MRAALVSLVCVAAAACVQLGVAYTHSNSAQAAILANNQFALDFFKVLSADDQGNFVASPISAITALAMVYLGSEGRTAQQLKTALHMPNDVTVPQRGFPELSASLQSSPNVTLRIANKIFCSNNWRLKDGYRKAVEDFQTEIQNVSFGDPVPTINIINRWVEQATGGKIKNLVEQGHIETDTMFFLVNAVYFYGAWRRQFPRTKLQPFSVAPNHDVNVPFMHVNAELPYYELPIFRTRVLAIPYNDESMKMVIFLPDAKDGLRQLEANLEQIDLSKVLPYLETRDVLLQLPKFKFQNLWDLKYILQKLQVKDLFTQDAKLGAISDQKIRVSNAVQRVVIEVSEKGTEAAAASAVVGVPLSVGSTVYFMANHPFLFFILGSGDTILFMGRVLNPAL